MNFGSSALNIIAVIKKSSFVVTVVPKSVQNVFDIVRLCCDLHNVRNVVPESVKKQHFKKKLVENTFAKGA